MCRTVAVCAAILASAIGIGVSACTPAPIAWDDVVYPGSPPPIMPDPAVVSLPPQTCPGSFHTARVGHDTYAVWWAVRPDSSSVLMAARSVDNGATWDTPVRADTLDVSRRGCARPSPALAADPNGYVYFAYFLESREGPGIFFTHTMDGRNIGVGNGVFHAPVAVVYGEKPSAVSLAAAGDTVAVAYEDPNSVQPQIGLALSKTTGHIFETRVPMSGPSLPAAAPHVWLTGPRVTVAWSERPDSIRTGGRVAIRSGRWQ